MNTEDACVCKCRQGFKLRPDGKTCKSECFLLFLFFVQWETFSIQLQIDLNYLWLSALYWSGSPFGFTFLNCLLCDINSTKCWKHSDHAMFFPILTLCSNFSRLSWPCLCGRQTCGTRGCSTTVLTPDDKHNHSFSVSLLFSVSCRAGPLRWWETRLWAGVCKCRRFMCV